MKIKAQLFIVGILGLSACDSGMCGSEPIDVFSARPDSELTLRAERKGCGATTGWVYELYEYRGREQDEQLLLRFEEGDYSTWPENKRELLTVSERSDRQLSILSSGDLRILAKSDRVSFAENLPPPSERLSR